MKDAIMVGTLARLAGVQIDTLRYYERRRILPAPARNAAGYRTFTQADVNRVRFIKQAQALGFTLAEIESLLILRTSRSGKKCATVRARAQAKAQDIDQKIQALRAMKKALEKLVAACPKEGPATECSFLNNLANDATFTK